MGNTGSEQDRHNFMQAARNGEQAKIKELLDTGKVAIDSTSDDCDYNVLHFATFFTTLEDPKPAIELLFDYCIKKNPKAKYPLDILLMKGDKWKRTPIHMMCSALKEDKITPQTDLLKFLLEKGSSVVGGEGKHLSLLAPEKKREKMLELATST